jgi:hypothetical protein
MPDPQIPEPLGPPQPAQPSQPKDPPPSAPKPPPIRRGDPDEHRGNVVEYEKR